MKINFRLLFYLKKPKNYRSGPAPIYLRITVSGNRSELVTGRTCDPARWNAQAGKANGSKEEVRNLNAFLNDLQTKVYNAHQQLVKMEAVITAESIRDKFLGKTEKPHCLIEVFRDHNNKMEALIGREYTRGTLCRYQTTLKHTLDFLRSRYGITDIDIRKVDHEFVAGFEFYLRSQRKCANNSAVKYIRNFGKIMRIGVLNGWVIKNPMLSYKGKVRVIDRHFLTARELEIVSTKELSTERLSHVRDIFLFSCYTGLAYIDVRNHRKTDIDIGADGELWIKIKRQKTNTPSRVPLLPVAASIVEQYHHHHQCENSGTVLPVLSNQKTNSYLKEIADVCGINKTITFHTARHTFATTVTLLNGVR